MITGLNKVNFAYIIMIGCVSLATIFRELT